MSFNPFLSIKLFCEKNINSSERIICTAGYYCRVPSIKVSNTSKRDISFYINIMRDNGNKYPLVCSLNLKRGAMPIDICVDGGIVLEEGDIILASTDSVDSYISVFVSVEQFLETPSSVTSNSSI